MPPNTCHEATLLLAGYKAALAAYDALVAPCFQRLASEHGAFAEAWPANEDAFNTLRQARKAYWRHVETHCCRAAFGLQAHRIGKRRYVLTLRTYLKF